MKIRLVLLGLATSVGALLAVSAVADEQHHGHGDHMDQGAHAHPSAAGKPGKASAVKHTIHVSMLEMRYEPSSITVKAGETVRFVIENKGNLPHEFGIGTHEEQMQHAEMMKAKPDMKHDDPSVVTLEPGQKNELIWQFTKAGTFEIACHVPGHYPAGMKMAVKSVK